jgi:hypothetical protein
MGLGDKFDELARPLGQRLCLLDPAASAADRRPAAGDDHLGAELSPAGTAPLLSHFAAAAAGK